jgi:mRNA-degrading endonuclease HigB of HigAB toxin-antitoxin module
VILLWLKKIERYLTLVDGVDADDNASFEIIGNALKVKSIFDFETKKVIIKRKSC